MGIVVESTQITTSNATTITIDKPVNLAVGDLLLAFVTGRKSGADGNMTWTAPAGWTSEEQPTFEDAGGNSNGSSAVFWKIATSVEVAASNFTFTHSGSTENKGSVSRITGHSPSVPISVSNSISGLDYSSPVNLAIGGTPSRPGSLLCIFVGGSSSLSSVGDYAITTSNPTPWTEVFDNLYGAFAYAIRTEITATGDVSFSFGGSAPDLASILIIVNPNQSESTILEKSIVNLSAPVPTITGGAVTTLNKSILNLNALAMSAGQALWSSKQKSAAGTWTAQSKS